MNVSRIIWLVLLAIGLAHFAIVLQWAQPVAYDEVEFFRATKWISEGKLPFRDYWEHHLPLQWFVFAPVATLANGPGVESILAMRWAQVALWIALCAVFCSLLRYVQYSAHQIRLAIVILLATPLFVRPAVEFRVDVLGNLGYLAALLLVVRHPARSTAWGWFGALMALAVLANMRLAPFVIVTAGVLMFVRLHERKWGFHRPALSMCVGVLAVVLLFVMALAGSGSLDAFVDAMRYNIDADRLLAAAASTLQPLLLLPFTTRDYGAIALCIGALIGAALALRDVARPGVQQLLALLAILSLLAVARLGVHYVYHLQTSLLLMAPLAARLVRERMAGYAALFAGAVLAVTVGQLLQQPLGAALRYQDEVMTAADARTRSDERVFDGAGYALRREPAYRYWFLPSGVRMLAPRGAIEPYDAPQMMAAPPAAIIHDFRVNQWLRHFPDAAAYVTHHYVPLYRDLWIPGMSALLDARHARANFIVPRDGAYRLVASELLAKHPWFTRPLTYALIAGPDATIYEVPLAALPPAGRPLRVIADGAALAGPRYVLKKGQSVWIESQPGAPIGVLLVPDDVARLFVATDVPIGM